MIRRLPYVAPIAALAFALALVPTALAGKPTKPGTTTGSGSLTLVMATDLNGDGAPNWGDTVTFNVSTTATTQPIVSAACVQNGAQVYYHEGGFYAGNPWPWDKMFELKSYSWSGGAADCTATLAYTNQRGSHVVLAAISFHVNA